MPFFVSYCCNLPEREEMFSVRHGIMVDHHCIQCLGFHGHFWTTNCEDVQNMVRALSGQEDPGMIMNTVYEAGNDLADHN